MSVSSFIKTGADLAATATSGIGGSYLNPNHQYAPYQLYTIDTFYTWNTGKMQIPIAGQTTPTAGFVYPGTNTFNTTNPKTLPLTPCGTTANSQQRQASEVISFASPFGKKVVVIRARRLNAMPVLPDPTPTDCNLELEKAIISPSAPVIVPDMKSRIFSVYAEYTYLLKQPIWVATDGVLYPKTDVDGYNRLTYGITPNQFIQGLI